MILIEADISSISLTAASNEKQKCVKFSFFLENDISFGKKLNFSLVNVLFLL